MHGNSISSYSSTPRSSLKVLEGFSGNPRFYWYCCRCWRLWSRDKTRPGSNFSFSIQLCLETINTWCSYNWKTGFFIGLWDFFSPEMHVLVDASPRTLHLPVAQTCCQSQYSLLPESYLNTLTWIKKKAVFCWPVKKSTPQMIKLFSSLLPNKYWIAQIFILAKGTLQT